MFPTIDARGTLPHVRWRRTAGVAVSVVMLAGVYTTRAASGQPSAAGVAASSHVHLIESPPNYPPPMAHAPAPRIPACNTYTPDGELTPGSLPLYLGPMWEIPGTYELADRACATFGHVTPPCTPPTFDQCVSKPTP